MCLPRTQAATLVPQVELRTARLGAKLSAPPVPAFVVVTDGVRGLGADKQRNMSVLLCGLRKLQLRAQRLVRGHAAISTL